MKVAIMKCDSYESEKIKKSILNGLEKINFKFDYNQKILIKPNVLAPHKPEENITTNPLIIEEICKIFQKYNSKIYIGDSSSHHTQEAFKITGIKEVANKYGTLINFENCEKIKINNIYFPKIIREVDLIVNVPKLKTHTLTKMTGGVKNLFGFISGKTKENYHKIHRTEEDFCKFLIKIYEIIKPQLTILDAIIGIEGDGPAINGKLKQTGLILLSKDAMAIDIQASKIIQIKNVLTNKKIDIEIVGDGKELIFPYKKPTKTGSSLIKLFSLPKISFNNDKCIKCGQCGTKCPMGCITYTPYPTCNHNECIHCFCCMEVCGEGAVYLKEGLIKKFASKIKKKF